MELFDYGVVVERITRMDWLPGAEVELGVVMDARRIDGADWNPSVGSDRSKRYT